MTTSSSAPSLIRQIVGFALALALTVIPFLMVYIGQFPQSLVLKVIASAAVLQILVHLRYFLDLRFTPGQPWFLVSIVFTAIILGLMVTGSLMILFDLNQRMMP